LAVESKKNIRGRKEAGNSGDGLRFSDPLLEWAIQCPQKINACRRSVRSDLPADPRPINEPGRQRVLRLAPSIRAEIGAWKFEYSRVSVLRIKPNCSVGPILGKSRWKLQIGLNETAGPQWWKIQNGYADEAKR
jgi:hypothetical protein